MTAIYEIHEIYAGWMLDLWVLTWGFFLLHRDLPDQRKQRQQQSEQLLPTGQFLRVQ